jgi:hypothetical protein
MISANLRETNDYARRLTQKKSLIHGDFRPSFDVFTVIQQESG